MVVVFRCKPLPAPATDAGAANHREQRGETTRALESIWTLLTWTNQQRCEVWAYAHWFPFHTTHITNAPPSNFGNKLNWAWPSPLVPFTNSPHVSSVHPLEVFVLALGSDVAHVCFCSYTTLFGHCFLHQKTTLGSSCSPLIQFYFTLPFSIHTSILIAFFLLFS